MSTFNDGILHLICHWLICRQGCHKVGHTIITRWQQGSDNLDETSDGLSEVHVHTVDNGIVLYPCHHDLFI